jgi:hypothetical protein
MDTARIIEELRAEKDRIEKAISAFLSTGTTGLASGGVGHRNLRRPAPATVAVAAATD